MRDWEYNNLPRKLRTDKMIGRDGDLMDEPDFSKLGFIIRDSGLTVYEVMEALENLNGLSVIECDVPWATPTLITLEVCTQSDNWANAARMVRRTIMQMVRL